MNSTELGTMLLSVFGLIFTAVGTVEGFKCLARYFKRHFRRNNGSDMLPLVERRNSDSTSYAYHQARTQNVVYGNVYVIGMAVGRVDLTSEPVQRKIVGSFGDI
ncbi:hypothetical protein FPQ18DRAFT_308186 [Pyronema domesticum]|nr:hypothetical protein FPQ18DRAFT_308186 [Pyronema domesticum]